MVSPKPKSDLLYICHRVPFPPNKGDKIRTFNQIKYLCRNWHIDLVSFADDPKDLKYQPELEKFCRRVFLFPLKPLQGKVKGIKSFIAGKSISQGYYFDAGANKRVHHLLKKNHYHAILCFSSPMGTYILENLPGIGSNQATPRRVMDFCDVDSDKWNQYAKKASFPMSLIYRMESGRLLTWEKQVNQQFDASVFVSESETALFNALAPGAKNAVTISNGVDFDYFHGQNNAMPEPAASPVLMFAGAMDYYANIDGVTWFCKKILPIIKKQHPDIIFMIVGSNPTPEVTALANIQGVQIKGFVEDIREYYQKADICVIPLRIARGVQNKVLEAMSMARPVVSTFTAFTGIRAEPGTHLLVEDNEQAFAKTVMALLHDPDRAQRLGNAARDLMVAGYAWDACLEKLDRVLR
jgi:polysaccharide biosynthesis protein PslH